jgi:hypothetical protein
MKRDPRRFLIYRWTMLECPNAASVNLMRVWHDRFGFVPPFQPRRGDWNALRVA